MQSQNRFEVNRRTVVRTAAWSAPAVAVAAGAPAYAATPTEPNLSGSTLSAAPTRNTNGVISVPENTATFNNTGTEAVGLTATIQLGSSGSLSAAAAPYSITDLLIAGQPYQNLVAAGFVTVTGLDSSTVTIAISPAIATIARDDSWTLPYSLEFITNEHRAADLKVSVAATNGGTSTAFPKASLAALTTPNLSTSESTGTPTRSGSYIQVPPTKFTNTGTQGTQGARVTVTSVSGQAITKMEANHPLFGWKDLTDSSIGCTYEVAPGAGVTTVVFRTPNSGLGKMNVAAGSSKTSAAPQRWTVATGGAFEFTSKVEPIAADPVSTSPVKGIGTTFRPAPVA